MPGQFSEWSDEALFLHFQRGHADAFGEIYQRFFGILYQHAFRMLANEDDAQDAVQEVFAALWTKGAAIELSGSLAAYLYGTTRNKVLNIIAANRSYYQHISRLKTFLSETDTATLEYLSEKELIASIEKEIQLLPVKMREIFELSRKSALSHKEIAARLQLSPETVKKQVSNAVRTIRHRLAHFVFFF